MFADGTHTLVCPDDAILPIVPVHSSQFGCDSTPQTQTSRCALTAPTSRFPHTLMGPPHPSPPSRTGSNENEGRQPEPDRKSNRFRFVIELLVADNRHRRGRSRNVLWLGCTRYSSIRHTGSTSGSARREGAHCRNLGRRRSQSRAASSGRRRTSKGRCREARDSPTPNT
jgi:hypothetical protein